MKTNTFVARTNLWGLAIRDGKSVLPSAMGKVLQLSVPSKVHNPQILAEIAKSSAAHKLIFLDDANDMMTDHHKKDISLQSVRNDIQKEKNTFELYYNLKLNYKKLFLFPKEFFFGYRTVGFILQYYYDQTHTEVIEFSGTWRFIHTRNKSHCYHLYSFLFFSGHFREMTTGQCCLKAPSSI